MAKKVFFLVVVAGLLMAGALFTQTTAEAQEGVTAWVETTEGAVDECRKTVYAPDGVLPASGEGEIAWQGSESNPMPSDVVPCELRVKNLEGDVIGYVMGWKAYHGVTINFSGLLQESDFVFVDIDNDNDDGPHQSQATEESPWLAFVKTDDMFIGESRENIFSFSNRTYPGDEDSPNDSAFFIIYTIETPPPPAKCLDLAPDTDLETVELGDVVGFEIRDNGHVTDWKASVNETEIVSGTNVFSYTFSSPGTFSFQAEVFGTNGWVGGPQCAETVELIEETPQVYLIYLPGITNQEPPKRWWWEIVFGDPHKKFETFPIETMPSQLDTPTMADSEASGWEVGDGQEWIGAYGHSITIDVRATANPEPRVENVYVDGLLWEEDSDEDGIFDPFCLAEGKICVWFNEPYGPGLTVQAWVEYDPMGEQPTGLMAQDFLN